MNPSQFGKYIQLEQLGAGTFGKVMLAYDTSTDRKVALKIPYDQTHAGHRLMQEEARTLGKHVHSNIVRVLGTDTVSEQSFIVMEFINGLSLHDWIKAKSQLPLDMALNVTVQILKALEYLHSNKVIHLDLKPANVLISSDMAVKLVDFGLARTLNTHSQTHGKGTWGYMAPEDFADKPNSDHRKDLWAVGVMLYEMLTGRSPFLGDEPHSPGGWQTAICSKQIERLSASLSDVSDGLQGVIDKG